MAKFYILWNPRSEHPPTKKFTSPEQARAVARSMAITFPGQTFYVCEAQAQASLMDILTELE